MCDTTTAIRIGVTAFIALGLVFGCGDDAMLSGLDNNDAGTTENADSGIDGNTLDVNTIDTFGMDIVQAEAIDEGGFMAPCDDDDDCDSGYCIQYEDELVCSEYCNATSCPDGWACRIIENSGVDAVRICVPNPDTLCSPCENNSECGTADDLCIDLAGSWVCGQDCEDIEDCPDGYDCSTAVDHTGLESRQCAPTTWQCSCSQAQDGENRPCVRQNEHGVCEGIEVCMGESGWSQCTAQIPEAELCDGVDNDCDGPADEGLEPRACLGIENEIGQCSGIETCLGESGWSCNAPIAAREICDSLDNDCNDIVDDGLCYDGDPCTDDICDPDSADNCPYLPIVGPCDDFDECTRNDRCTDGTCEGEPVSCYDGNECTDDTCNPLAGCELTPLDSNSCETGNFCTQDYCVGTVCTTGPDENCPDTDQCNVGSCDPDTGCHVEALSGNSCNDEDPCTDSSTCASGDCVGPSDHCDDYDCGPDCTVEFITCWSLESLAFCTCVCL